MQFGFILAHCAPWRSPTASIIKKKMFYWSIFNTSSWFKNSPAECFGGTESKIQLKYSNHQYRHKSKREEKQKKNFKTNEEKEEEFRRRRRRIMKKTKKKKTFFFYFSNENFIYN